MNRILFIIGLIFFELDKTVVLWSDWLVFCDYGFRVPALRCPIATPTVLLGFLLPWTWSISSWLLQQGAAAAPSLNEGYLLTAAPPDLEPTRWAWVWANSGSLWWTGRPGVLWFVGSQRVGHDWTTELNWILFSISFFFLSWRKDSHFTVLC